MATIPGAPRRKGQLQARAGALRGAAKTFDVLIMADMAGPGDVGLRIAGEIEALWAAGFHIGLVHTPSSLVGARIAPPILRAAYAGKASVIGFAARARAELMIVHVLDGSLQVSERLRAIKAGRIVLVADRALEMEARRVAEPFAGMGPILWAPTNQGARASLQTWNIDIKIAAEDWRAVALSLDTTRVETREAPITLGYIGGADPFQWPATREELQLVLPTDGSTRVVILGRPPKALLPDKIPANWNMFDHGETAVAWVLRRVDALAYFPRAIATEIPDAALATAAAAGKLVILPPRLRAHFGPGAVYSEAGAVSETAGRLLADEKALVKHQRAARASVKERFSPSRFAEAVTRLTRRSTERGRRAGRRPPATRALFLASNGIGLGHVARLLAIARRCEKRVDPLFVTMAQATHVIEQFGYRAEFIPSEMYVGAERQAWDAWFGFEIERLINCHRAGLVVYDGNNLGSGLSRSIMAQGDCKLVWVKRSMGDKAPLPLIEEARSCDLIVEPGEISARPGLRDLEKNRLGIVTVPPVRLLDDNELLTRDEAAVALGLDPARPAVLIHLGAGSNRDISHIVDAAVRELRRFPEVQTVIAEWANAASWLELWPDMVIVRGFPLSRYFNAFDFSIGAAGYNTFHEAICLGLPTIFVANDQPGMDDQVGRARFAQDAGAAFELPEDGLSELSSICEILLNESARNRLRENCRRIRQKNGAAEAAIAIAQLLT